MPNELEKISEGLEAAWNSHDIEQILSFFTDDCVYEDIGAGKVNHGKEEIRTYLSDMLAFSSDVQFKFTSFFGEGNRIANEWIMSGTHTGNTPELPATGKKYSIRAASITETQNGKISKNYDYWNQMSLLRQLGVIPKGTPNWCGRLLLGLMMKRQK